LSEESKRKFTITAGTLGAVFFLIQVLTPFFATMFIIPAYFSCSFRFPWYDISGAAISDNQLYFTAKEIISKTPAVSTKLMRIDLGEGLDADQATEKKNTWKNLLFPSGRGTRPREVADLEMENPRLLAGTGRLLLVSRTEMWEIKAGDLVPVESYESLGTISRPFYYEGAPAVVERGANGLSLAVFRGGGWERTPLHLGNTDDFHDIDRLLQVITIDGTNHVFLRKGRVLSHRVGLPLEQTDDAGKEWKEVSSFASRWQSFILDGKPAVLLWRNNNLSCYKMEEDGWSEIFNDPAEFAINAMAPLPQDDGSLKLAIRALPSTFGIYSANEKGWIFERSFGRGSPLPQSFMAVMIIPHIVNAIFPIALAFILSGLMMRHRIVSHSAEGRTIQFAPLARRALAQMIDGVILAAGILPFALQLFHMFGWMGTEIDMRLLRTTVLISFGIPFIWTILLLIAFSWTEGKWGITPGKWLLGIRVVGIDLESCGFGRALLRNFLKVVDGFFNFMVGILMVAFSRDWQRVGDMAARTIVIRRAR